MKILSLYQIYMKIKYMRIRCVKNVSCLAVPQTKWNEDMLEDAHPLYS